jgi:hypothetical protein
MPYDKRSAVLFLARTAQWAALLSLALLSIGCATRQVLVRVPPDPLPANLAALCDEGPPIPASSAPAPERRLDALLPIWQARESAAAECRDRHRRTVEAWPK